MNSLFHGLIWHICLVITDFTSAFGQQVRLFSESDKQLLVNLHNAYRRSEGGSDMQMLVWDSNLEWTASQWARECDAAHSPSRDRFGFGYESIGENMWWHNENSFPNLNTVIYDFWEEKSIYDYENRLCQRGRICGHYTTLASANTCAVGCAASICPTIRNWIRPPVSGHIIVCNYGPEGTPIDRKIFRTGPSCSECGGAPCKNGLCVGQCVGTDYEVQLPPDVQLLPTVTQTNGCTDESPNCVFWAINQECTANPVYMNRFCPVSCNSCENTLATFSNRLAPIPNANCQFWANNNQCVTNPAYMFLACRPFCR